MMTVGECPLPSVLSWITPLKLNVTDWPGLRVTDETVPMPGWSPLSPKSGTNVVPLILNGMVSGWSMSLPTSQGPLPCEVVVELPGRPWSVDGDSAI